jgi:hypothetical protein
MSLTGPARARESVGRRRTQLPVFAAYAAALISLAVYLSTLIREADWWDAAELALQSYTIGVTHPPGYPVYTLIGKFFTLFIPEPAIATNVMSAVFTSLCAAMLCATAARLRGRWIDALIASITFAFVPVVWSAAVTTEVYNVNMLFLALVFYKLIRWHDEPYPHLALSAGVLYGLSMGTYPANILILPAFLYLIVARRERLKSHLPLFVTAYFVCGALVISLNYFIARINPPFGSLIIPDSLKNLYLFVKGDQFGTLNIHSPRFYAVRVLEHGLRFSRNFFWAGIALGLLGLRSQWKKHPVICRTFLLAFAINMLYFTFYDVKDYETMVAPSYYIFSIWIAYGIGYLGSGHFDRRIRIAAYTISLAMIAGLFAAQIEQRLERSRSTPVSDFVAASFEAIPRGAVAIAPWHEFAPLYYHHRVHGERPDITLVEYKATPYMQIHGIVPEWRELLTNEISSRAVVAYGIPEGLERSYRFISIADEWYRIAPLSEETGE